MLALSVRRVWVRRIDLTVALRVHLIHSARVLSRNLATIGGSVTNRGQVRTNPRSIILSRRSLGRVGRLAVDRRSASGRALTFFVGFALIVFLLLAGFPFFPNFFELCRGATQVRMALR